jgi:hypothetical protein
MPARLLEMNLAETPCLPHALSYKFDCKPVIKKTNDKPENKESNP